MPALIDGSATGDVAIVVLRRQGLISVPVYLWTASGWVDVSTLTVAQFSAWVDLRCQGGGGDPVLPVGPKVVNLTISRYNDW